MAFNLCDWTWETTITTGTGDYALGGAVSPYRAFGASGNMANGDTTYVSVFDGVNYEEGLYTYNSGPNTLTRTTVYRSTNGNAAVNWGSGTKQIMAAQLGITLQSFLTPGSTGIPIRSGDNTWSYSTLLPIASGGTNGSATPTAGAVAYGTGTAYAFSSAGTAGQYLQSNGSGTPSWATVSSSVGQTGYYASLYDAGADQTAASTTTAYVIRVGSSAEANGISVVTNGSYLSRITVTNAGTYTFQPSIQFTSTDTSIHDVDLWFRKNGSDVANSDSQYSVPNQHGGVNGNLIAVSPFTITLAAGDYIELVWSTTSTNVYIHTYAAGASPTTPVVPGVIVSVTSQPQIGLGYADLTSTTSTVIGTGSKTFTVNLDATADAYVVGSRVRVASSASPSNFMEGIITAYSGTSLTVNVDSTGGSGTLASWNFSIAGIQGNSGLTVGTTTVSGGTSGRVLYDNAGVVGEYTVTGTAGSVVLSGSPALTGTPTFAGATSGTIGLVATAIAGSNTLTLPAATDTLVGKATTDTLTNKSISGSSNTLTNIPNSALTNSSITLGTTAMSLGSSYTTIAGAITWSGGQTFSSAMTYGGVTLSNSVTGTGSMVLSSSPTLSTPNIGAATGTSTSLTGGDTIYNATAIPAGGTTGSGYKFSSTANFGVFFGSGAPTLSAAQGSLYVRSDGAPYYNNNGTTGWTQIGAGITAANDSSTATAVYPLFAAATTGTLSTVYTSNGSFNFTPSTGELAAKELNATNGLIVNSLTINSSYTIASGNSAMSVGPITVAAGAAVTVPSGSRWLVL